MGLPPTAPSAPPAPRPAEPRPAAPPPRAPQPARPAPRPTAPPQNQTLNLDLGAFTPLSPEQVRAQARGITFNFLFGRRDLIPPVTDPRTLLIDRAMVGQGLIAPEELQRIHAVGEEMDAVRPDFAVIQEKARQAVRMDREARQRLKAQKKAEAATRKEAHAQAVAKRKASDIIFLGRGVSKGLADRTANVERLTAMELPVMATPADVAKALGITIPRLRWLAFHSEAASVTHYVRFTVPKRSGGRRELAAPHEELAAAQEWILTSILNKVHMHDAAHGFITGRSTVTNATPHVGRQLIVNADLKDFFPSITFHRVAGLFRHLGYSPAAATILGLLCTECPRRTVVYAGKTYHVATGERGLPQGACTSPALSNMAARGLDRRLAGICGKLGWTYTRYADDLTLSADGEATGKVGYLMARLRHIAQDEGFEVNEKKTRVQRPSMAQTVTGIVVNRRPGVDRQTVRRLRAILHQAGKTGLESQNRQKLPHFKAWLRGMIDYIHMVNPAQAKPLREAFVAVAGQ
ncbi:MAG: reverse transcriptase family protein [Opitutales bacterium]